MTYFGGLYPANGRPRLVVTQRIDPQFWNRIDSSRGDTIVMVGRIEPQKGRLPWRRRSGEVLPRHRLWQARFIGPWPVTGPSAKASRATIAAARASR